MKNALTGAALVGLAGWGLYQLWQATQADVVSSPGMGASTDERDMLLLATGMQPIMQDDAERIHRQLERLDPGLRPLYLHTVGGYFGPAMDIAHAVKRRGGVHAIVPTGERPAG